MLSTYREFLLYYIGRNITHILFRLHFYMFSNDSLKMRYQILMKKIKNIKNVKELYLSIEDAFLMTEKLVE